MRKAMMHLAGLTLLGLFLSTSVLKPAVTIAADTATNQNLVGVARPHKQVILIAPIEGTLGSMLIEEGQVVEQGQVLAVMDDAIQKVIVEAAQMRAESTTMIQLAQLLVEDSRISLDQIIHTRDAGAASEWEVRRAQVQKDQAEAEYERAVEEQALAQVNLKLEQARLDQFKIRAPFSGTIRRIEAEAGATLRSTDTIIEIAGLDPLEGHFYLPVSLLSELTIGKIYTFQAGEPINQPLTGQLKTIDPIIDTASKTVRCVFTIPNEEQNLRGGFKLTLVLPE